jgi:exonuclease VII small subunit
MDEDVKYSFERVDKRLEHMNTRLERMDGRLEHMNTRLERMDGRLEHMNTRLESMDGRLESIDQSQQRIVDRLDRLIEATIRGRTDDVTRYADHESRIGRLEKAVDELQHRPE